MNIFAFTTARGIPLVARLVPTGATYGRDFALTAYVPMIEFFDLRYPFAQIDPAGQTKGQFAGRYYVETIAKCCGNEDLCLHGDVPDWNVDADSIRAVMAFFHI